MRDFDFIVSPAKLLTPEIVQMVSSIHEHKGKQELFLEANVDELKTLLEVALIQSTGASNRIEGIFTSDKRLEELVSQKAEPRNRSEQEIAGYREVLSTIHEGYEYINPRPNIILQLHRDLYSYSQGGAGGSYKNSDNVIAETDAEGHQKVELTITNTGDRNLEIKGTGKITVGIPCDRCLEEVSTEIPLENEVYDGCL